jgi:hypothetical protein
LAIAKKFELIHLMYNLGLNNLESRKIGIKLVDSNKIQKKRLALERASRC